MHLKSLTLKGFKSFPDRTRLEFGPGVSVVVGPNGSGKSNVTDAVLWAMGEQSPLAVHGQSMQDVIFGGGKGAQARPSAEVEIVIDNGDGAIALPMGEISILRRLDRSGEGEYRLNGAKCRLVDVLEILSDTGLGKEMHSVVSQGRVEAIVTSKPKDRRLLIEEAAGLGKHRKRRRRAQLKLERTQDNLDRCLDVEREARSRLRPLKRQAEAAELHERLERQSNEARWELARDAVRGRRAELEIAEAAAVKARADRDEAHGWLGEVAARRERAEEALARRSEEREELARRVYTARSSGERVEGRLERTRETADDLRDRIERRERQLGALNAQAAEDQPDDAGRERVEALAAQLEELDAERTATLERELATLTAERDAAAARVQEIAAAADERRAALTRADEAAETARRARKAAEASAEAARREAAQIGAELAKANQFLRSHAPAPGGARSLADTLDVEPGCELAVAAALGGRLAAAVVDDLGAGGTLLDRAGSDGGRALIAGDAPARAAGAAPVPGARALAELVRGDDAPLAQRLLANAWLVETLDDLAPDFDGVAVTRTGRAWFARTRELRQAPQGGAERVLEQRNRRDALVARVDASIRAEQEALAAVEAARAAVGAADGTRDEADRALRGADRERTQAVEAQRRATWLIEERSRAPEQGEAAVRRAQVLGELAAEQRVAERAARERAERAGRIERLTAQLQRDRALVPAAERLVSALAVALGAIRRRTGVLEVVRTADRAAGEGVAAELRACAAEEARIQTLLRERGETVTVNEVRAQQARDAGAEAASELQGLAERLGLEPEPATEALAGEEAEALRTRIERLARRREQL